MDVSTSRILTPARIVVLTPTVILIGSLAYLRFAARRETVPVPAGAKAGGLSLEPCDYPIENGNYGRRLRNTCRTGESGRSAVAADRAAGDPDPRPLRPASGADLPP